MANESGGVSNAKAFQPLLDHAVRCWAAEEENARRIASKVTYLASAIFGLSGVVVVKLLLTPLKPLAGWWQFWSAMAGSVALAAVLLALWRLFDVRIPRLTLRKKDKPKEPVNTSSNWLWYDDEQVETIRVGTLSLMDDGLDPEGAEGMQLAYMFWTYNRLEQATLNLKDRNAKEQRRIRVSQSALWWTVCAILVSAGCWIAGQLASTAEEESHEPPGTRTRTETSCCKYCCGEAGDPSQVNAQVRKGAVREVGGTAREGEARTKRVQPIVKSAEPAEATPPPN